MEARILAAGQRGYGGGAEQAFVGDAAIQPELERRGRRKKWTSVTSTQGRCRRGKLCTLPGSRAPCVQPSLQHQGQDPHGLSCMCFRKPGVAVTAAGVWLLPPWAELKRMFRAGEPSPRCLASCISLRSNKLCRLRLPHTGQTGTPPVLWMQLYWARSQPVVTLLSVAAFMLYSRVGHVAVKPEPFAPWPFTGKVR